MDGGTTGYQPNTQRYWDAMPRLDLNQAQRKQPEIAHQGHPAADGYDLLRTRILGEVAEREWTRVGVTQAATGRAAPLTALNLALSEARRPKRSIVKKAMKDERNFHVRAPTESTRASSLPMPRLFWHRMVA